VKNLDKYEVVIGLEVHAQLLTKSKLFSGDSIAFGAAPNTQVSPISLAHPGTLPVMNKEVMNLAIRLEPGHKARPCFKLRHCTQSLFCP